MSIATDIHPVRLASVIAGLASYGSDSEGEEQSNVPAPPVASGSGLALQPSIAKATASPASTAAVHRIKGAAAASRNHSPLTGVKLPSATASPRLPASPARTSRSRESSSSPPPYARAAQGLRIDREEDEGSAAGSSGPIGQARGAAGVRLDALAEFGVPPLPTGPCKPSVEAKLANFHNLRQSRGLHFNDSLHASKAFRNPRIYAKLVEFVDVHETGTNWVKDIWDPSSIGPDASATRLAELQKLRSDAKAAQPAGSRSSIAFSSAPSTSSSRSGAVDDRSRHRDDRDRDRDRGERKKSRWDKGGRDRSRSPRRR
ncbi:hypothetical protein JCM11641_001150 [Rhodosporidiobolus odoratus]